MAVADPDTSAPARPEPNRMGLKQLAVIALQLFGLCGLAVADPIFQIIRGGPTFLVAHGLSGGGTVVFVLVLVLVPALLLTLVVGAVGLVSARLAQVVAGVFLGLLAAVTVVSAVDRSQHLRTAVYLVLFVVVAAVAAFAYLRLRAIRTFTTFLAFAPVLFAVSFLFFSPVADVAFGAEPSAASLERDPNPVVMIIFDEFPLSAIQRSDGSLNSELFPSFARLAGTSTWYPNATSVAPWTNIATPALDTGLLPDAQSVPTAANYPRSLFTMVGQPGRVHATESETALCPRSLCAGTTSTDAARASTVSDTLTVYLHQILPDGLADRWLSPIDNGWAGFGGETELAEGDSSQMTFDEWNAYIRAKDPTGDPQAETSRFLESLSEPSDDGLWYLHLHLPHMPYQFLPDGQRYPATEAAQGMVDGTRIGNDLDGTITLRQRLEMQAAYADDVLGQILDQLQAEGILDKALVVVTSDHGVSLEPGSHRRSAVDLTEGSTDSVLPVPLFIKYPGQTEGKVDDRDAMTIDVVPTIADALHVRLPDNWSFDGVSLLADPVDDRTRYWVTGAGGSTVLSFHPDPQRTAAFTWSLLGPTAMAGSLFAIGPHADLVGRDVATLPVSAAEAGSIAVPDPNDYETYRADAASLPALLSAGVDGIGPGQWLAVAVGDRIVGMGPTFVGRTGAVWADTMLDLTSAGSGSSGLRVFLVASDGTLSPVAVR